MSVSPALVLPPNPSSATDDLAVVAAARPATDRLALLDAVRLAAAIGIIWVHSSLSTAGQWLHPIGTFGVPFYTFVAVLFMARTLTRPNGRSLGAYAVSRTTRLYLPFLLWSAIYVGVAEARHVVRQHSFTPPEWCVLYAGGHQHLWFLPFLMVVTLLGAVLVTACRRWPPARWPVVVVLVTLAAAAAVWPEPAWVARRQSDLEFWRFSLRALPTVFASIALALAAVRHGRLPRSTRPIAVIGGGLLLAALLLQLHWPDIKVLRTLAGVGCVTIALLPLASPTVLRLGTLGRHSYGIYLSHLLFVRPIVDVIQSHDIQPTFATDALTCGVAFVAAATLSVLLSKSPWTRWTLGE